MLNSAADYKCVDVTGFPSGTFTGEVLPKRDNRGDGSWRAMKYEDLLFLQEAKQERLFWFKTQQTKVAPLGRKLDKYAMKINANIETNPGTTPSSTDDVSGLGGGKWYVNKDTVLSVGIESMRDTGYYSYDEMLKGYLSGKGASLITDSQFAVIGTDIRLSADDVRKAYFNLKKLKRTCYKSSTTFIDPNSSSSSTEQYETRYGDTGGVQGSSLSYLDLLYWFEFEERRNSISRCVLHGFQYGFKDVITTLPYAKSAKLLLLVKTRVCNMVELSYFDTFEETNVREYFDVVTCDCTVSNGAIHLPSIDTDSIASDILSSHSITRRTSVEYSLNDIAYVSVVSHCFVVDHDFPAEIDSLNWNWQPQST